MGHAVVITRWAQPEVQRVRKTYVDAFATLPRRQGLGHARGP